MRIFSCNGTLVSEFICTIH